MSDDHPKKSTIGNTFESPENARRKFLKTIGLVGGGLLLYSVPTVSALASTGAELPKAHALNIALPAQYAFAGSKATLEVTVEGQEPEQVDFTVKGEALLTRTADPTIANVRLVFLEATSADSSVVAKVRSVGVGQLSLQTGRMTSVSDIPVAVNIDGEQLDGQVTSEGAKIHASKKAPHDMSFSCGNCFCNNTVKVGTMNSVKGNTTVKGPINFAFLLLG